MPNLQPATTPPVRRLVGTLALVTFVVIYAFLVMVVATYRFPEGSAVAPQLLYFAVAGILWIFPAGWLIRWMYRPVR